MSDRPSQLYKTYKISQCTLNTVGTYTQQQEQQTSIKPLLIRSIIKTLLLLLLSRRNMDVECENEASKSCMHTKCTHNNVAFVWRKLVA